MKAVSMRTGFLLETTNENPKFLIRRLDVLANKFSQLEERLLHIIKNKNDWKLLKNKDEDGKVHIIFIAAGRRLSFELVVTVSKDNIQEFCLEADIKLRDFQPYICFFGLPAFPFILSFDAALESRVILRFGSN